MALTYIPPLKLLLNGILVYLPTGWRSSILNYCLDMSLQPMLFQAIFSHISTRSYSIQFHIKVALYSEQHSGEDQQFCKSRGKGGGGMFGKLHGGFGVLFRMLKLGGLTPHLCQPKILSEVHSTNV